MKRCLCSCSSRLSLALCLSGCSISQSTLESNRDFAVPEVGTAACGYDLPDVIEDRTSGHVVIPVGMGGGYDFTDTAVGTRTASRLRAAIAAETAGVCQGQLASGRLAARVVMYDAGYLDIAPAMERIPVGIVAVAASIFTLGLSPIGESYNYAVCIDVSGADGSRRAGFSQGKIRTVINIAGEDDQITDSERQRDEILDQLAIEAWHMAWAAHPSGAGGTPDCEVAMKEFIKRCEIYCR